MLDSIYSLRSPGYVASLTRHPLVQRFLRGATSLHPTQHHRFPTWRLHTVLWALMNPPFEPMKDVGLKWIKLKTIFLVAITSARRVSELGALSCKLNLCELHRNKVVLRTEPTFQPKVASKFHTTLEIALPLFCPRPQHPQECKWHTLDVQRALKFYLAQTESIRTANSLFINIPPPRQGNKMLSSAISAALQSCIKEAYIALGMVPPPWITAHSTRSAATSAAFPNRASVEEICRAAA